MKFKLILKKIKSSNLFYKLKYLKNDLNNKSKYLFSISYNNKFEKYKNKKKIIYMLLPEHGNMGDQAIAYATNEFLKDKFPEYCVLEIYSDQTFKYIKKVKRYINKDDIILLHGGGNMGNLYVTEEIKRREIVNQFKNNFIISMTQTATFTSDAKGQYELNLTKKSYGRNKNLVLLAREQFSYKVMKEVLGIKNVILNPDIVFYLNDSYNNVSTRERIMTCLRNDNESVFMNKKEKFLNDLRKEYNYVFNYDTVINRKVDKHNRKLELRNILYEFSKSKVVITDRLHGMVFCVITKTPCIVLRSLDNKVIGTYKWIEELNYIKMVDDLDFIKIKHIINELLNIQEINNIDFRKKYFESLTKTIKSIMNIGKDS